LVAQAARLLRQTTDRDDEHVCLVTDATPDQLDAPQWLHLNRGGFGGIENGLHQRLDVSQNDDRCRIRQTKSMWIVGMFRRLSNSLFMEWRSFQRHPEYKTTTDFQAALGEDHRRAALRLVSSLHPNFAFR
jgi:hypothetical protein